MKSPRFIFPPHPAPNVKITPETLHQYEAKNAWIAQRKFNGAHCVIWVYQNRVALWNRRGEPFRTYKMTEGMRQCILCGLNRDYNIEYVFDGELMHNKAKLKTTQRQAVENTIVLYDILYAGGHLTSLTTMERLDLLYKLAKPNELENKGRAFKVEECQGSNLWVAQTFLNDFSYHFWEMFEYNDRGEDQYPDIEGLVLKQRTARNVSIGSRPNDVNWIVRCRKTKEKVYQF